MNKEIELWKEKTKGVFHIIEYKKFWNYIGTLQKTNEQYEITYKKIEAQDKIINTQALEIARLKEQINIYENPDDMTLMFMWCDEKAKDKIKELQARIDKAIEIIKLCNTPCAKELLAILGDKENVKN